VRGSEKGKKGVQNGGAEGEIPYLDCSEVKLQENLFDNECRYSLDRVLNDSQTQSGSVPYS